MNKAAAYLKKSEWSMGNGQCPECCGVSAKWFGHSLHTTAGSIGHQKKCALAKALRAVGVRPLMMGDFKSDMEFELCLTESGFVGARQKTKDGCPRWRAMIEQYNVGGQG